MLPYFKTYYKHNKDSSIGKKRNKYVVAKREISMLMDRLMSPEIDLYRQIDA